ncbi:MAG: sulfurtransferase [Cyanobacteria bacterium K_DeepCast_35m_m2_023]|nr:sulfurtransferase [Cyanobacteria bacterium K_DeepCast_35m_m2_023]
MSTPQSIRATALQKRLQAGEPIQLVDVREDQELQLASLGLPVIHLPLSRSREWIAELEQRLDRDRPVAVLCHAGIRSWQFGCWLIEQHGFAEVLNLHGGIEAWSIEVDPSVLRY